MYILEYIRGNMKTEKYLKILLWIVSGYHILLGLLGVFAKEQAVYIANNFFNFNLTLDNQMLWVLNPFAAYLLFFGIFMALAATDPKKYKKVIYIGVGLFALRLIERIIFLFISPEGLVANENPIINMTSIFVVFIMGLGMYLLTKKLK